MTIDLTYQQCNTLTDFRWFTKYPKWADKTILIYEPHYESALLLIELLRPMDVNILLVSRKSVIKNFSFQPINLIIKAIEIKEMITGLKMTKEVRARYPKTPMIAHSACTFPNDIKVCINAGCNDFIPKPFILETLLEMVTNYLECPLKRSVKSGGTAFGYHLSYKTFKH